MVYSYKAFLIESNGVEQQPEGGFAPEWQFNFLEDIL